MSGRSALCREQNTTMPSASRQQPRPEARHNVTSDYPRYDLHFAAASGNLGLVEYALKNGQPINSVLNGVLPLHAACAGGSEVVVKFLIDQGADVNAPRLPRRLSNEKHKSTGMSVGASGSTPLHFAAANGHMAVVNLLLVCGAAPDKPDKHGVTPEMLARENGWIDCAEALAAWAGGRKGDLPPVQHGESSATDTGSSSTFFDRANGASAGDSLDDSSSASISVNGSKRLHVKRSIDNALHKFKAPLTLHHHVSHGQLRERDRAPPSPTSAAHHHHQSFLSSHFHHSHSQSGSPSHHCHLPSLFHHAHSHSTTQLSTGKPLATIALHGGGSDTSQHSASASSLQAPGDQATREQDSAELTVDAIYQERRPSLPQMFDEQTGPFKRRTPSRRRRPRSAGSDGQANVANRSVSSPVGQIGTGSGNGSSNSIASVGTGQISSSAPSAAARKLSSKISLRNLFRRQTTDASSATTGSSEPNSVSTSFSNSSAAPIYGHILASSPAHANARGSASPTPPASPLSSSFSSSPAPVHVQGAWYRQKMGNESGNAATTRSPLVPSAVELHHQYSDDNLREFYDEPEANAQPPVAPPLSSRPSILRGHNRSSSSSSNGGGSTSGSGPRTLRFDASPSGSSTPSLKAIGLRGCRSASSLRHGHTYELDEGDEDDDDYGESLVPDSAPPDLTAYREDELERPDTGSVSNEVQTNRRKEVVRPAHLLRLAHGGQLGRARGESFASNGSSSPGATPDTDSANAPYTSTDFPFSLDRPPLTPLSATSESTQHTLPDEGQEYVHVQIAGRDLPHTLNQKRPAGGAESRGRGESFSSVETDESTVSRPDARSQASSDVTSVTTPSPGVLPRKGSVLGSALRKVSVSDTDPYLAGSASEPEGMDCQQTTGKERDGDDVVCPLSARNVSDLAGAQDLVRRAQQAILVSASAPANGPDSPGGTLSEQLAAYGEILALERRFARGEKQRTQWAQRQDSDDERDIDVKNTPKSSRIPQSAKEARAALSEKRRNNPSKQRGVTVGTVDGFGFSRRQHSGRPMKSRRPHTAEGATQHDWGTSHEQETPAMSRNTLGDINATPKNSPPARSHVRSTSTPLHITVTHHDGDLPILSISPESENGRNTDIQIIETTATPIDDPSLLSSSSSVELTPQLSSIHPSTCPAQITCPLDSPSELSPRDVSSRYTIDDPRPHLPPRSRTPDPDSLHDVSNYTGFSTNTFGTPLTRVATAPLQDSTSLSSFTSASKSSGRWGGMKPMSAKKLVKMGIPLDAGSYSVSMSGAASSGSSIGPSPESSRSPSKARFGGIKSLVKGLTSKS